MLWLSAGLRALLWPTSRRLWTLRWMGLLAGFVLLFFSQWRVHQLDVTVAMEIPGEADAELYYSFNGSAFYPELSQFMVRRPSAVGTTFQTRLFTNRPILGVRLDPLNKKGELLWSAITFSGVGGSVRYSGSQLQGLIASSLQLQTVGLSEQGLRLTATGIDPQITMAVPASVTRMPSEAVWRYGLSLLGLSVLCAFLLDLGVRALHPDHRFSRRGKQALDRAAATLSEDATIRFSRSSLLVLIMLLLLAVGWVGLKLHQSSLGMWDGMYPREHVDRLVNIGTPKAIRTDEWNTFTPWVLGQVQTGMAHDHPNFGAPGAPILAGAPIKGPLMLAQPKFWGFLALDIERGFAWMWAYKSFGLIAAFFLLLLALTKGDTVVSLAGALGLYGASYVQWWYSSVPPEIIVGFSMALVGSIYLLQARKLGGMLFGALALSMAVPNLLLNLYPPSLLPLVYLSLILLGVLLVNREGVQNLLQRWPARSLFAAAVLGVWVYFLSIWYREVRDTIELMTNTHYPGHRFALGGDRPLDRIFFGFFESWQTTEDERPFEPSNNSEMSNFWMLFPVALLLVRPNRWFKSSSRVVLGLMVFCVIALLWSSGPLPDSVRHVMAHAGWFMVPGDRIIFGLGMASTILIAVLMAGVARADIEVLKLPTPLLACVAFMVVLAYGLWLQLADPVFFHWGRILLGAGGVAGFVWAIHKGQRLLYLALSLAVAMPMMYVNPVQSGIAPYLNKGLFVSARHAGGGALDHWAVFGNLYLAQGFKLAGLSVLNGTHYAPRMEMIRALDPELKHEEVWNRYAHIELKEGRSDHAPDFEVAFLDHYVIKLDVCGPHIRAAGVTHVAFDSPPSAEALKCLLPISTDDGSRVALYRLKPLAP